MRPLVAAPPPPPTGRPATTTPTASARSDGSPTRPATSPTATPTPPSANSSPTPAPTPSPTPSPANRSIPTPAGSTTERGGWIRETGRLVGMDPWAGSTFEPASLHRYLYGRTDPLNHRDPSGELVICLRRLAPPFTSSDWRHVPQSRWPVAHRDDPEGAIFEALSSSLTSADLKHKGGRCERQTSIAPGVSSGGTSLTRYIYALNNVGAFGSETTT